MKIKVTEEHIRQGGQRSSKQCPVSLAIQEQYPSQSVSVGNPNFRIGNYKGRFLDFVSTNIARFDNYGRMEPFEFEIPEQNICGLCGEPGADKIPHPIHWPGEQLADTELVHSECENEECQRAHAALTDQEREEFLRMI